MFIFDDPENIPPHLPAPLSRHLMPWFSNDQLEEGLVMLKNRMLSHFFLHRNTVGALLQQHSPLTLTFEKTDKIAQGFTLKNRDCPVCIVTGTKKPCAHLAALCILSLRPDQSKPLPMPLYFQDNPWSKIAALCHDWLSKTQEKPELLQQENGLSLVKETREGRIEARLSFSSLERWTIFTEKDAGGAGNAAKIIFDLYQQVVKQTMTDGEQLLAQAGSFSKGYQRDSSLWNRLGMFFYGLSQEKLPALSFDTASTLFQLNWKQNDDSLHIELPRHYTPEFFKLYDLEKAGFATLSPARRGAQVRFNNLGQLVVKPQITLSDGRTFLFSDLAQKLFGRSCYLHGEGFIPLQTQRPEATLTRPQEKAAAPLLAFIQRNDEYIVEEGDIESFLETNKKALAHEDNLVEPAVLTHRSLALPDSLIITDFHEDNDWCYLSCEYQLGNSTITMAELLDQREGTTTLRRGNTSLRLKESPLDWFYDLSKKRGWKDGRGVRLSRGEFMALVSSIDKVSCSDEKEEFITDRLLSLIDTTRWHDPTRLTQYPEHLREYQKNGLAWLHALCELGLGGLLADDMGLGKTHQGLALIDYYRQQDDTGPMLVVCPTSVLPHWQEKIEHFYPDLVFAVYYGPGRNLEQALQADLMLTTYGVARADEHLLYTITFDLMLLDEMQQVKNRRTGVHQAVSLIPAKRKIGLSGTPIENSLDDLYALFSLCLPGLLGGPKYFTNTFVKPITESNNHEKKALLSRLIRPFILRRSRSQVLTELPDIISDNRTCRLSDDQIALYRDFIAERQEVMDRLREEEEPIDYLGILALITRLKQICNHPCLLTGDLDPQKYQSGKWDLFTEILDECLVNERKVVVFSQYTGMLDLIEYHLKKEKIGYAALRGSMPLSRRKKSIKQFAEEKNCRVFSASLLAGGTGIDLVAGQVVIHYDRWWNPAKEEQATARVHRMGQKEVVQLFRLITVGTLEEKIHHIITKKQKLAEELITEDEAGAIKQLDRSELLSLFSQPVHDVPN